MIRQRDFAFRNVRLAKRDARSDHPEWRAHRRRGRGGRSVQLGLDSGIETWEKGAAVGAMRHQLARNPQQSHDRAIQMADATVWEVPSPSAC